MSDGGSPELKRALATIAALPVAEREAPAAGASGALPRELVKLIAMDIGKQMVAYIEVMYPEVWAAGNSGFRLSVRNHIHNDIIAAIELHDEASIMKWLADRKAHRREWLATWRRLRANRRA